MDEIKAEIVELLKHAERNLKDDLISLAREAKTSADSISSEVEAVLQRRAEIRVLACMKHYIETAPLMTEEKFREFVTKRFRDSVGCASPGYAIYERERKYLQQEWCRFV